MSRAGLAKKIFILLVPLNVAFSGSSYPSGIGLPPFCVFSAEDVFLSLVDPANPDRFIGYRVVEGDPEQTSFPLPGYGLQPQGSSAPPEISENKEVFPAGLIPASKLPVNWKSRIDNGRVSFRFFSDGTAVFRYRDLEHRLTRVSVFRAVRDGLEAWMWLEADHDLPGAFAVQQCLRLTGADNDSWRHRIAFFPELSEFDLWNTGRMRSLTWVACGDGLREVEPVWEFARQRVFRRVTDILSYDEREQGKGLMTTFRTDAGIALAAAGSRAVDERLRVPNGLIVRESADSGSLVGMYWERSVKVSNHHPADCLHSYVDLGPVIDGRGPVVRGKIYFIQGSREELLKHWHFDFKLVN